jgi:5'-nucleotidase
VSALDAGAASPPPVHVQILAINDFHGNIEPPAGTNGFVVAAPTDPIAALPGTKPIRDGKAVLVPTGGAAYLAAHLAKLRATNPNTVVVSAGDLTGASPLESNLFKDEPTILVMNQLGLDYEAVGNHDFDRGMTELERLEHGGCSLGDCDAGGKFAGASFTYLGANVTDDVTKRQVFAPYAIRTMAGVKVAFIGETLQGTPTVSVPSATSGLVFANETQAANALVPELEKQGVAAIVLVVHQGGMQGPGGTYDSCEDFSGDLPPILHGLDPAIDVVVSGHTHQAYDCTLGGRLVTSAASYGRLITQIDLTIDPAARKVIAKHARNVPVTRDVTPDAEVAKIVATYEEKAAPITRKLVGRIGADFVGNAKAVGSASCETPLGDLIADAMLESTKADIAFMNPGGIRADLLAKRDGRPDGSVTYAEAFDVQPFGNHLVTMSLTADDIRTVLESQFGNKAEPRILQVSRGFSYHYVYDRATRRGTVDAILLHQRPLDPKRTYRVTVPSFLAAGGDGFGRLAGIEDRKTGPLDIDALIAYLQTGTAAKPLAPPARSASRTRIDGNGCK